MTRPAHALLALALFTTPAVSQSYDGQYQIGQCTPDVSDSQMSISGDQIRFWESSCTLTNPVPVRDMAGATLFDAVCSGEGENWTYRLMLMPGTSFASPQTDLIMLREGSVVLYQRCR
jgi:hypothetical protein